MTIAELILVRHGESVGNVAREQAERDHAEVIALEQRDADVPLSDLGCAQAEALGTLLAERPVDQPVDEVWVSPYVRTRQTAQVALQTAGLAPELRLDERLRDRELGILDTLTGAGVRARFPAEAQRRRHLGKLYYRPPGGESWADVALRLRSFLRDIDRADAGPTVLVVTHDAVITLFRYILQQLTEAEVLELAAGECVDNASVTRLVRPSAQARWEFAGYRVDHLERCGSSRTSHPAEPDSKPH